MKKSYEEPSYEILAFETEDIMTTSVELPTGDNEIEFG